MKLSYILLILSINTSLATEIPTAKEVRNKQRALQIQQEKDDQINQKLLLKECKQHLRQILLEPPESHSLFVENIDPCDILSKQSVNELITYLTSKGYTYTKGSVTDLISW